MQMRLYFGERERDRDGDGPLDAAVVNACARRGVHAAVLMRGVEGFGAKHRLRTDRLLSLSEDTPLVALAVGEDEVVDALVEDVKKLASEGLLVVEPVEALDGSASSTAHELVKATIWGPRTGPTAPHLEAVAALKRHGAESATVLLGLDGVLDGERRRARFVAGNHGVPAITVGVGRRDAIDAALAEVDGAAHLATVEAVALSSDIDRVLRHSDASAVRVTLVTSEIATRGAHPAYLEFIHQLRREGAPGATAQRGVWGFRGEGEPHGDRVLALGRDVPMLVEVVDAPERAGRWLELAHSLAPEGDVVHSQAIGRRLTLE
jgi:PII-like signaling protein